MPAAAVIPAPIAYIKVAAVKKLVVGFLGQAKGGPQGLSLGIGSSSQGRRVLFIECALDSRLLL